MKTQRILYAPEMVYSWKNVKVLTSPINTEAGMGNYWMPIFDSEEECKKHYPNARVLYLKAGFNEKV